MNKLFYVLFMAIAFISIIGFTSQGCAKSGDEAASNSDSEPEFTITGEAI